MPTDPLRLSVVGDIMLGRLVDRWTDERDPLRPWGELVDELRSADATVGNLECCISERGQPWDPLGKPFHFRARPWAADALAGAGFDIVSLANNHALDYGADALEDTLALLDASGVAHAGAGEDLGAAASPAWIEAAGRRVALLAAADHPSDFAARAGHPGTRVIRPRIDHATGATLLDDVRAARRAGADAIVASLHWGPNMNRFPLEGFPAFARALVDAGADLVHGHSAHVFQAIEMYDGRPILYDTGDFVDDYAVDPVERNDLQFLFRVAFGVDAGPVSVELLPLRIEHGRVRRADSAERRWLFDRMRRLCAEFGTTLERRDGRLTLAAPA